MVYRSVLVVSVPGCPGFRFMAAAYARVAHMSSCPRSGQGSRLLTRSTRLVHCAQWAPWLPVEKRAPLGRGPVFRPSYRRHNRLDYALAKRQSRRLSLREGPTIETIVAPRGAPSARNLLSSGALAPTIQ